MQIMEINQAKKKYKKKNNKKEWNQTLMRTKIIKKMTM